MTQTDTRSLFEKHTTLRPRVVALLCLAALTSGCKKADVAPTPEVTVQAEKVTQGPLTEYISGDTVLSPVVQAAIVPKISAPVQRFLVQRGEHVKKGQLLAVLENSDLSASVEDSRGALEQADASYLTATRATAPEDLTKAKLDQAQAQANLDLAQTVYKARKTLFAQGAIPRRDLDTAQAALVQARAAYDIAKEHYAAMTAVGNQAALKSAQGALQSAKARYAAASAGLSYSEIRSPINGVVTERPLFAGEMANGGQAVVTVMDLSALIAKLHLSQEQAQRVTTGDDAVVKVPGLDDVVHGKVTLVSPALDPGSTTLEVWVTIPNQSGTLKSGTAVHVSIAGKTLPNVAMVPNPAILNTKSGTPAVMVVGADSLAHLTDVKTGITDGHDTQMISGVSPGDLVITEGGYGLDDGTKVKIGPAVDQDAVKGDN